VPFDIAQNITDRFSMHRFREGLRDVVNDELEAKVPDLVEDAIASPVGTFKRTTHKQTITLNRISTTATAIKADTTYIRNRINDIQKKNLDDSSLFGGILSSILGFLVPGLAGAAALNALKRRGRANAVRQAGSPMAERFKPQGAITDPTDIREHRRAQAEARTRTKGGKFTPRPLSHPVPKVEVAPIKPVANPPTGSPEWRRQHLSIQPDPRRAGIPRGTNIAADAIIAADAYVGWRAIKKAERARLIKLFLDKEFGKFFSQAVLKKIPIAGLLFSSASAIIRYHVFDDKFGAGLEVAAMGAWISMPLTGGVGGAVAVGIDLWNLTRDFYYLVLTPGSYPEEDEDFYQVVESMREAVTQYLYDSGNINKFNADFINSLKQSLRTDAKYKVIKEIDPRDSTVKSIDGQRILTYSELYDMIIQIGKEKMGYRFFKRGKFQNPSILERIGSSSSSSSTDLNAAPPPSSRSRAVAQAAAGRGRGNRGGPGGGISFASYDDGGGGVSYASLGGGQYDSGGETGSRSGFGPSFGRGLGGRDIGHGFFDGTTSGSLSIYSGLGHTRGWGSTSRGGGSGSGSGSGSGNRNGGSSGPKLPPLKPGEQMAGLGGVIPMKPNNSGLDGLLEFVSSGEGGYNSMNKGTRHGSIIGSTNDASKYLGKDLTEMTIGEVMAAQASGKLFAAGYMQFIPSTLKTVAFPGSGLSKDDLFDERSQRILAQNLIMNGQRPNLAAYIRGDSDNIDAAMMDIAKEFASMPNPKTGNSYYGHGNRSSHSVAEVRSALQAARASYGKSSEGYSFAPRDPSFGYLNTYEFQEDKERRAKLGDPLDRVREEQSDVARTRKLPIDPELKASLAYGVSFMDGLEAVVASGGQHQAGKGPRVGTSLHDTEYDEDGNPIGGRAADIDYTLNGRVLKWTNPKDAEILRRIYRRNIAAGLTGFGVGTGAPGGAGYMQEGRHHIGMVPWETDIWGGGPGLAEVKKIWSEQDEIPRVDVDAWVAEQRKLVAEQAAKAVAAPTSSATKKPVVTGFDTYPEVKTWLEDYAATNGLSSITGGNGTMVAVTTDGKRLTADSNPEVFSTMIGKSIREGITGANIASPDNPKWINDAYSYGQMQLEGGHFQGAGGPWTKPVMTSDQNLVRMRSTAAKLLAQEGGGRANEIIPELSGASSSEEIGEERFMQLGRELADIRKEVIDVRKKAEAKAAEVDAVTAGEPPPGGYETASKPTKPSSAQEHVNAARLMTDEELRTIV